MRRRLRSGWAGALRRLALAVAPLALAGCGAEFEVPTETAGVIGGDGEYQMVARWDGLDGLQDVLLTQGSGAQLFVLFNHGGTGPAPRGDLRGYPRLGGSGTPVPLAGIEFRELFNPVALAAAGGRLFVLDQGDTCLARANPASGECGGNGWSNRITDLAHYWRVREYGLLGGDTLGTFTDTTLAFVTGIAAQDDGTVYVAGTALVLIPDPNDARIRTRTFQYRIHRYRRGPRYPGVLPADRNMPGADWHRDTTWVVEEGSGIGTVQDPRGLARVGSGPLFVADYGKNWMQRLSETEPSTGDWQVDAADGAPLNGPLDVAADLQGNTYVVDAGNLRVLRFGPDASFDRRVDKANLELGTPLVDPVALAADDTLVYLLDRGTDRLYRYRRRT